MRDHPIPQDITGYQFHIIGNMTIKQFAEILLGVFLAVIVYSTNLIAIVKWPLIGSFLGLGAMMAFVPFEERPLDHWIITFFRVLYKPTKFFWRREPKIPEPFLYEATQAVQKSNLEVDLSPARRERIKEYLQSVNQLAQIDPADLADRQYQDLILGYFNEIQVTAVASQRKIRPDLRVQVRSLRLDQGDIQTEETTIISENLPADLERQRTVLTYHAPLPTEQVAQNIAIPEIDHVSAARTVDIEENEKQHHLPADTQVYVDTQAPTEAVNATQSAAFNADLPFPSAPTEPNKLVGMVLTPHNELVNDAIVEIQDANGSTVRAVKTNALGQFFVSTPLANGDYFLITEKEGLSFQPLKLHAKGEVVQPIEIRSIVWTRLHL